MPRVKKPELRFPLKLTQAQCKAVAAITPSLAARLKLDEPNQRIIDFTVAELKAIKAKAKTAIQKARTGYQRRPLRLVLQATDQAIAQSHQLPRADIVYQFKITLLESQPPIWRRIQVKDCTLDKLHEHLQTAMGWTNSHLNHFRVGEQLYGDPELMQENFEDMGYKDSTTTKLSAMLPQGGKRFRFSTSTTLATPGITRSSLRACCGPNRGASTLCAWKGSGPVRPRMWAECGATPTLWRPSRTQTMRNMREC